MKKLICIVLVYISTMGCATITIDGRPRAKHVYSQRNPSTGMRVDFLFVRYKEIIEDKERFEWPVYLELNKLEKIPSDTKRISIRLQIVNPYEVEYTLEVWCKEYNRKLQHQTISKSRYPNRVHEINLQMKKDTVFKYFFRLIDEKGKLIMDMGNAKYIIEIDWMKTIEEITMDGF